MSLPCQNNKMLSRMASKQYVRESGPPRLALGRPNPPPLGLPREARPPKLPPPFGAGVGPPTRKRASAHVTEPGYQHEGVIHRRGESKKLRERDGVKISTNAIEGYFSRVTRFLRKYRALPKNKEDIEVNTKTLEFCSMVNT